ncbi:Spore wall protein 25 [Nosema granulosis]|uniref:Spore wall protein 25 n=1 Tax=Nosema granulosis TaxID=83296 RepID=A0A9P6GWM1_9MICR|nr:Spore wall protein 25 [Nosema granulosis]
MILSLVFASSVLCASFVEKTIESVSQRILNTGNRFSRNNQVQTKENNFGMKVTSCGKDIESCLKASYEEYIKDKRHEFSKITKDLTQPQFIDKTKIAIMRLYPDLSIEDIRRAESTLKLIYNSFTTKNKEILAIFVTHAIFNTSVFKVLEEKEGGDYKSRGLLMIQGQENYKHLDKIVKRTPYVFESFEKNPKALVQLNKIAIDITVQYFMDLFKNHKGFTYIESLNLLKPMEFVRCKQEKHTASDVEKLVNRTKLYNSIVAEYK